MKERLPFVALLALSRKARVAAGASSFARLPKVEAKIGSGCPSFGGQRTVASSRTQKDTQRLPMHLSLSIEAQSFQSSSLRQLRRPGAFLQHPSSGSVQARVRQLTHPALVCFAIQIQSKVASPRAWPNPSFKRTRLRRPA